MWRYCELLYPVQSSAKTFLPGLGNGWLKYCTIASACLGFAMEHFEVDSRNLSVMFLHNPGDALKAPLKVWIGRVRLPKSLMPVNFSSRCFLSSLSPREPREPSLSVGTRESHCAQRHWIDKKYPSSAEFEIYFELWFDEYEYNLLRLGRVEK